MSGTEVEGSGDTPVQVRLERVPGGDLPDLNALVAASLAEELRFVKRLQDDWVEGRTRFDGPGEALFVAYEETRVVGVCGLTRDPFAGDSRVGRVRRLFVLPGSRGHGTGQALLGAVIHEARGVFRRLHVRTPETGLADGFYQRLGFRPLPPESAETEHATHRLDLE
jgi:GNAT superfamily N-acetyltransferase